SAIGRSLKPWPSMRMLCRIVRNPLDNRLYAVQARQLFLGKHHIELILERKHDFDVLERIPCRRAAARGFGAGLYFQDGADDCEYGRLDLLTIQVKSLFLH